MNFICIFPLNVCVITTCILQLFEVYEDKVQGNINKSLEQGKLLLIISHSILSILFFQICLHISVIRWVVNILSFIISLGIYEPVSKYYHTLPKSKWGPLLSFAYHAYISLVQRV